jgi:hypothetical protein
VLFVTEMLPPPRSVAMAAQWSPWVEMVMLVGHDGAAVGGVEPAGVVRRGGDRVAAGVDHAPSVAKMPLLPSLEAVSVLSETFALRSRRPPRAGWS